MRGLPAALRARTPAVAGYVTTPVKHSDLLDALVILVSRRQTGGRETRRVPMPARRRGRALRILIAEDNAVNRTLVTKILEKRGHNIVAVENGRAAVDGVVAAIGSRRPFDVVVMDIQMPIMDGLEATGAIRDREATLGGRTPIVALTAHAMSGDRERCLEAGMTAYLVKPLQPQQLIETVESLAQAAPAAGEPGPERPQEIEAQSPPGVKERDEIVDEADALKLAGGDRALMRELAQVFLTELPDKLSSLRTAAAAGDAEQIRLAAHALKGSTAAVGGRAASDASSRVEHLGRSGNVEASREALADLEAALEQLASALQAPPRRSTRNAKKSLKGRSRARRPAKAGRR
jgi:two-component system, sensor histidine kinase and response regulator